MTGFTILTRDQVVPKTIMVQGVGKLVAALNPGPPPAYPAGASLIYQPDDLDIYSADPNLRRVLLADPNGKATFAEIIAAFPGYLTATLDVVREKCQAHILKTYPLWYQSNVALGIYGTPLADKLRDDIASVITESNRCEELIWQGLPYTLNLPVIGG